MTNITGNKTMMNLQDSFLNHVRKENLPVIIYLVMDSKSGDRSGALTILRLLLKMKVNSSWYISMRFLLFPR